MEFRLRHRSLQTEEQSVVEESRMVESVLIADEGVGDAAQIQEPIPVGIVPRHPGDFDGENEPDVAQPHLSRHQGKAMTIRCSRP